MRREISLKENSVNAILMRNRREEIADIPSQYITNISYDINSYTTMTIEIPSKIQHMNEMMDYFLYELIKGKMTIVLDLNGEKFKFILDDDVKVVESKDGIKKKTISAYSYEKTLEKKTFLIGSGATRQLFRQASETVEVSDGILNWFEEQTQWKVGHIDNSAKKEYGTYAVTNDIALFTNFTKDQVTVDGTIWEKTVSVSVANAPVNMVVSYTDMETYKGTQLQKKETISHSFNNLPYPVKKIKAVYTSDVDQRYGVTYTVTMAKTSSEEVTQQYKFAFANAKGLKLVCPKINLNHNTGEFADHWTTKYRYFEECTTNWYGFLMNDVAKAFDVVFMFDSFNQVVNVYSKDELGESRGLYLSYENVIKSINKTHKYGDIVTRLTIESPHVSIAEENPLGGDFVECYDYYINSGIMSSELKSALEKYKLLTEQKQIEFLTLKLNKTKENQKLTQLSAQLKSLEEQLKGAQAILTAFITAGDKGNQATQSTKVKSLESQITTKQNEIATSRTTLDNYQAQIVDIGRAIVKENAVWNSQKIFTAVDLEELEDYTIEGAVQDDTYTVAYSLYNWGLQTVKDSNDVYIDFTIDCGNLLKNIVHPNGWQYLLRIGDKIEMDDAELVDKDGYVQLYGFDYSPKDNEVKSLKFTNNKEPQSAIKSLANIGRQQSQTSTMTTFYKDVWKDAQNNNVVVSDIIARGLDVASSTVRGRGDVNRINITEAGIYIADSTNTNHELYLGHGLISMTNDGWQTAKMAMDENGLIANTLIGELILGEELHIANEEATFKILPDGLHVYSKTNGTVSERVFLGIEKSGSNTIAKLRLMSADGKNNLVLSENGIYNCYQVSDRDSFDYNNSFKSYFYVPSNLSETYEAKIVVNLEKFRAYSKAVGSKTINLDSTGGSGNIPIQLTGLSGKADGTTISGTATTLQNSKYPIAYTFPINAGSTDTMGGHTHPIPTDSFDHTHGININLGSHSHPITVSGSASASEHSHSIEMPSHDHNLSYGIYEYNTIPTCKVFLNGVDLNITLNNSTTRVEKDILTQFKALQKGMNVIEVRTTETSGLARASFTLFWGGYFNYS